MKLRNSFCKEVSYISFLSRVHGNDTIKEELEKLVEEIENNLKRFLNLCQYHEIVPFVYNNLKRIDTPKAKNLLELFKNYYYYEVSRAIYLENEYFALIKKLQEENIDFISLKGIAFYKDIYPDLNFRSMVDIDILVHEGDLKRVEEILKEVGYEKDLEGLSEDYWLKDHCHLRFRRDKVLLEIHWDLAFRIPREIKIPQLWERTKEIEFNGFKIKTLSPEDNIICLALHQRRFNKPLCLKNVLDLVALLNKYKDIDWDYLIEISYKNGMLSSVYFLLLQAKLVLEAPISEALLSQFKISWFKRNLMAKIILENTFSEKLFDDEKRKSLYFKLNFLLYDNLFEFLKYLSWIPQEKFAKFCKFEPYAQKTKIIYKLRWFYLPIKILNNWCISKIRKEGYGKDKNLQKESQLCSA